MQHHEKAARKTRLIQPVATPVRPWEERAMDFIVDLPESQGNTGI